MSSCIAFKMKNHLTNLISNRIQHTNTPTNSTCPDCNMRYVRQTGRSFHTRYNEHYRDYKYNNKSSKYAQHLIENRHSIGSIKDSIEILHIIRKGKLMDTWKKIHIYQETTLGSQINEKSTVCKNILFDTILQTLSDRGHP